MVNLAKDTEWWSSDPVISPTLPLKPARRVSVQCSISVQGSLNCKTILGGLFSFFPQIVDRLQR